MQGRSRRSVDGRASSPAIVGVPLVKGAIHLLNGLHDAKADHQPVVAIVGQHARSALGGKYQQEVDLVSLFKDVAHDHVQMATVPEQLRHLVAHHATVDTTEFAGMGHPGRPEASRSMRAASAAEPGHEVSESYERALSARGHRGEVRFFLQRVAGGLYDNALKEDPHFASM